MPVSEQRRKELAAIAEQNGRVKVSSPQAKRQSFLGGIARDLATPFVRTGVNAYNFIQSAGTLGAAGIAKLAGNDEQATRFVLQAGEEAVKARNVPFLGEQKPVLSAKDVVGTGAQIASTLAGGGAAKSAASKGLGAVIKQSAKEGVKIGATTGGLFEAGKALSEDKSALEVLQSLLVGGVSGGALGGVAGAVLPVAGAAARGTGNAAKRVVQTGRELLDGAGTAASKAKNIRNPLPMSNKEPGIFSGIAENVRSTVNKAKGSLERSKINVQAQREAREMFERLADDSKNAIRKGLQPRDVNLIKSTSAAEKQVYKRIIGAAEAYADNRATSNRPSAILGEEFSKRIRGLGRALENATDELDDAVRGLGGARLQSHETVNSVLERLGSTTGLKGLNVAEDGVLDFSKTQLSGTNSATARKELQKIFDDIVQRADDAERLHLYRKELFEDLGGKKSSGIKLTGTEEKAVNAMRQGMADAIESVAPKYKEANTKVAKLLESKREISKKFGEVSKGNEDIFDVKSSILLRRLTSNAKTGQDMAELIRVLEGTLGDYGIRFDTDLVRIQEFLNLLDRYYDIAPDTSLLGITRADAPKNKTELIQRVFDIVGENFKATDETAKQAIRDLIGG